MHRHSLLQIPVICSITHGMRRLKCTTHAHGCQESCALCILDPIAGTRTGLESPGTRGRWRRARAHVRGGKSQRASGCAPRGPQALDLMKEAVGGGAAEGAHSASGLDTDTLHMHWILSLYSVALMGALLLIVSYELEQRGDGPQSATTAAAAAVRLSRDPCLVTPAPVPALSGYLQDLPAWHWDSV